MRTCMKVEIAFGWGPGQIWLHTALESPWPHYMVLQVSWDGLWTLSFGLSQFHGRGSWLVCESGREWWVLHLKHLSHTRSVLHGFGSLLGRPLYTFCWALTNSWSRPLDRVWKGPWVAGTPLEDRSLEEWHQEGEHLMPHLCQVMLEVVDKPVAKPAIYNQAKLRRLPKGIKFPQEVKMQSTIQYQRKLHFQTLC